MAEAERRTDKPWFIKKEVIQFTGFYPDGSFEFEFSFNGECCRLRSTCLEHAAVELGRSLERRVDPINCARAVGPLLAAMAKEGWKIESPPSSPCIAPASTKSTFEHA